MYKGKKKWKNIEKLFYPLLVTLFSSIKSKLYFATAYTRRKYFYFFRLRKNWRNEYLVHHFSSVTLQNRILILFKRQFFFNLVYIYIYIFLSNFYYILSIIPTKKNSLFTNSKNWQKKILFPEFCAFYKNYVLKKKKKTLKIFLISLYRLKRNFLPFFPL